MSCYEIVVVGAGPAGLGFCSSVAQRNKRILIIDSGKKLEERNSQNPDQVGNGVTGAGAFIDGKFSFFPAGTGIWRSSYALLSSAYAEMHQALTEEFFFDAPVPPMPTVEQIGNYLFSPEDFWKIKPYKSLYMNVPDREKFWKRIVQNVEHQCELSVETRLVAIHKREDGIFALQLLKNGIYETVFCQKVVLAGGRFMPLQNLLKNVGSAESIKFRRHEFGFRIQVPTDNPAIQSLRSWGLKDPKLVMSPSQDVEYRTFCFCVDGEVSKSCIDGLVTFSGRADVDPTGFTNFAILVRTTSPTKLPPNEIEQFLKKPFVFTKSASLEKEITSFLPSSPTIATLILAAIQSLFAKFPDLNCDQLKLFGPCLEGVGEYPNVDLHMQVQDAPGIYAIGDTHGGLRGLVPSFLCGFYLAHCLQRAARNVLFISRSLQKYAEICAVFGPLSRLEIDSGPNMNVDLKISTLARRYRLCDSFRAGQKLLVETTNLTIGGDSSVPALEIGQNYESWGPEKFLLVAENSDVTMTCHLSLVDGDTGAIMHTTVGTRQGKIVKPRGSNGFGWDLMFLPHGCTKTFAEMMHGEKNWHSARSIAVNKLSELIFFRK